MSKAVLHLDGIEGYFAFRFGWVHCLPDRTTGALPPRLDCLPWQQRPAVRPSNWQDRAEQLINELERRQSTGDLDFVSVGLPTLEDLADRLEAQAEQLSHLAERARAIAARHEPSADER
jgi:hypothetical protein